MFPRMEGTHAALYRSPRELLWNGSWEVHEPYWWLHWVGDRWKCVVAYHLY
jgi:hypothetical protein